MSGPKAVNQTSLLLSLADKLYASRDSMGGIITDKITTDFHKLTKQRVEIASLLNYYGSQLNAINPVIFNFMTSEQRIQLQKQYLLTLYLYVAQERIDEAEDRFRNIQNSIDGINKCLKYLDRLKKLEERDGSQINAPQIQLDEELSESEKHAKYLGLTVIAPWLTSKIMEFVDGKVQAKESSEVNGIAPGGKTTLLVDWMSELNSKRLYWVWGGGMIASALELLAFHDTFPSAQLAQANTKLHLPSPYTGYMSWVLYYTRFGINLGLLLKHTFRPSPEGCDLHLMPQLPDPDDLTKYKGSYIYCKNDDEETKELYYIKPDGMVTKITIDDFPQFEEGLNGIKKHDTTSLHLSSDQVKTLITSNGGHTPDILTTYRERFKTQWNQRKFTLLNDFIWATANMVCFFWLKGSGALGYGGNVLTGLLLLMDLCLNVWALVEQDTRHNAQIKAFREREKELLEKRNILQGKIEEIEETLEGLVSQSVYEELLRKKLKQLQHEKAILDVEIKQLQKTIKQDEFEWKYKKYGLINNIAYSAGLLFSFSLLCCFFFPPAALAPALVLTLAVAGAALCFILTVAYTAINSGLELAKSKASAKNARKECRELVVLFNQTDDQNTKKQLYLEMKHLLAESKYRRK